jgi:hypothetical protein
MGLDCATFEMILQGGFERDWDGGAIPRMDTRVDGVPRLGRRSFDSAGALGLALHYLASAIPSVSLQLIFTLIPSTVCRYLNFSLSILLATLRTIPESSIRWTKGQGFMEDNEVIVARHPMLTYAFATVDGLRSPVEESSDPEIENATYNGWVHEHNVNSVFVFSPRGESFFSSLCKL